MTTYRFAHSPRPPPVAGKMSNTAKAVRSIARKESTMKLILCDTNERLCAAWKHRFAGEPDVEVIYSRFEDVTEYDAIVSPGNSFGLMDGGIDAAIIDYFGCELMQRVQTEIMTQYCGEQPVGTCLLVYTDNDKHPVLAHTPTMRIPRNIQGTDNVYNAMRAMLVAVKHSADIKTVLCPGLGTCTGGMPEELAAACMYMAWRNVMYPRPINWKNAVNIEVELRGAPGWQH